MQVYASDMQAYATDMQVYATDMQVYATDMRVYVQCVPGTVGNCQGWLLLIWFSATLLHRMPPQCSPYVTI